MNGIGIICFQHCHGTAANDHIRAKQAALRHEELMAVTVQVENITDNCRESSTA